MPTSAEVYAWPEGELLLWTGSATSVAVARVKQSRHQVMWGWQNNGPSLAGTYTDHLTGQRADVMLAGGYTYDAELIRVAEAATAVHMEFRHDGVNGSAGWKFWSGRVGAFSVQGGEGQPFTFSFNYHCNQWSAYGG